MIKINKWYVFGFFLLLVPIVLIILTNIGSTKQPLSEIPTPTPIQQESFRVVSTTPEDKTKQVYPGEIIIAFSTDKEIVSPTGFTLEITPALSGYWKFTNTYPTKNITAQVYGDLATQTTYTLVVKDARKQVVQRWSFTTAATPAASSSNIVIDRDNELLEDYYPLHSYVPFSSNTFSLDYTGRLTLEVIIKNGDQERVKDEVMSWIQARGIDPTTHTINYITQ